MEPLLEHLAREWAVIRGAPAAFLVAVALTGLLALAATARLYEATLSAKNATIEQLQTRPCDAGGQSSRSFAVVSSEGNILAQENFARFGMTSERRMFTPNPGMDDEQEPEYWLRFDVEPDHFEVRTSEGAQVTVEKRGRHLYRVTFNGSGWGNPFLAVNFRVVAE